MNSSRTHRAIKNSLTAFLCQVIGIVASFASRTVFTILLGSEYLGVSGLFTNILTILSFAELGFGSAIVYRLYAPLANKDDNKVRLFLRLYKKVYSLVACVVLVAGVSIIPFLKYLVKAPDVVEDIRLLYILYLLHTVLSYIFVYKKSLLIADQNDYIVSFASQLITICMHIVQIVVLLITHDFVLYAIVFAIFPLIENAICGLIADKKYGKRFNSKPKGELTKDDYAGLKKDIKGLMLTNVAATVLSGTDNLFISSYIGIKYVGILSNYSLILTTINGVMNRIFASVTAIVGNLAVSGNEQGTETVLKRMYFLNASFYSYICIGMILLIKEFVVNIWLDEQFLLTDITIILAISELYFRSLHYPLHTVQMAMGLFSQYRIMYLVAAVANIILDFLLEKDFGIAGLIVATILCRWIIFFTDIYVVYKYGFKKSVTSYAKEIIKWLCFVVVAVLICKPLISLIKSTTIIAFIVKVVLISIVYLVLYIAVFFRKDEFKYFYNLINKIFRRKKSI